MREPMEESAHLRLESTRKMVQYQVIRDIVLWDTAHNLSRNCACSFSMEENGCDSSFIQSIQSVSARFTALYLSKNTHAQY